MKEKRRIRETQLWRSGATISLFVVINLVLRAALLPINEAEYTDGILQLIQFAEPSGIYPPLYTALSWLPSLLVGELWGGRVISVLFSTLAVVPLYLMAQRSFGSRAAFFTALVYTVAPAALRWAPRVMTEATFTFFFWYALERLLRAQGARDKETAESALLWANVLGALAALTRYQGMMLLIPPVLIVAYHAYTHRWVAWKGLFSLALYGLVPLWSMHSGNIHGTQFQERGGEAPVMNTILNAEAFLVLMPYFLTYPVALLAMLGMNSGHSRPRHHLMPLTLFVLAVVLPAQSLFGSFQERYMLPFFGLIWVWAGLGLAIADHRLRRRFPRARPYAPIAVCVWSILVAALVLLGSREVFGDLRRAAEYAARTAPAEARIFTNEIYRDERPGQRRIAATKVEFFAQRSVFFLTDEYYMGRLPLREGDLLLMNSAYAAEQQITALGQRYRLEVLEEFSSSVIPVFPDIMSIPGTAQNPMAWYYRYHPQVFSTSVWRVTGRK